MDQLKSSLPKTLTVFYPLAGRIHEDGNGFICNDEGVPYVETVVENKPLFEVLHKIHVNVSELDSLLPACYGQYGCYTRLLLAIQVNCFACGGLAIGVKLNHALSDVFGLFMFVKAWTSTAKYGRLTLGGPHPCFDSWKVFPPPPPPVPPPYYKDIKDDDLITKWFMFKEVDLISLGSKLISYDNNDNIIITSSSSKSIGKVLSAFIYKTINVACHNNSNVVHEIIIPCEVLHRVSIRHKVSPVEDHNENNNNGYYFGNMALTAIAKPKLVCMYDFIKSAEKAIEKITSGWFVRDMKEGKVEYSRLMKEQEERKRKGEVVSMGFSDLRSLPVYEPDFGWGKPVWVTYGTTFMYKDLVVLINAGPATKDIVAYICLSRDDMAKLEGDVYFGAYVFKGPTSKL